MKNCMISTYILIQDELQDSVLSHLANQKDFLLLIHLQSGWISQIPQAQALQLLWLSKNDKYAA